MNRTLKAGLAVIVVGCSPLLLFLLAHQLGLVKDPNPNPIGLGLLFFVSLPIGLVTTTIGAVLYYLQRRKP